MHTSGIRSLQILLGRTRSDRMLFYRLPRNDLTPLSLMIITSRKRARIMNQGETTTDDVYKKSMHVDKGLLKDC